MSVEGNYVVTYLSGVWGARRLGGFRVLLGWGRIYYLFSGGWSQRFRLAYAVWMRVRVLYFGVLKDVFGCDGEVLELADGASVAALLRVLRGRGLGFAGIWDSLAVALNQSYVRGGEVLKEGDEVALLPPVSGGVDEVLGEEAYPRGDPT